MTADGGALGGARLAAGRSGRLTNTFSVSAPGKRTPCGGTPRLYRGRVPGNNPVMPAYHMADAP